MLTLELAAGEPLSILAVGAHADDIEIGCAGALMTLCARHPRSKVRYVVLSADAQRAAEARAAAHALLGGIADVDVTVADFRERFFPYDGERIKDYFDELGHSGSFDMVFTPRLEDRHQDHRLVAELACNTWRNHLICEYEIVKYEGDLGQPNTFVALPREIAERKVAVITEQFPSQASRTWFSEDAFMALLRIRGIECNAPEGFAEAFTCRKLRMA